MTQPAAAERVRLEIGGMTCASCAARIERKLNKLDGVEASVNYATEEASVAFDPGRVRLEDLVRTVEATGYRATLPAARAADDGDRRLRLRLIAAIALTIPV